METREPSVAPQDARKELAGALEAQVVLRNLRNWLQKHEQQLDAGTGQRLAELTIFRSLVDRAE